MKRPLKSLRPGSASLMSVVVALLMLLAPGAWAQSQTFCNNETKPCNPDVPPKPGELGCFRPPPESAKCEPCQSCTRSPCHVGSGAYSTEAVDLAIPTSGFPITVSRRYQSTRLIDGESGYGWVSSLSTRLYYTDRLTTARRDTDNFRGDELEADVRFPNGVMYRFAENIDGTFTPPAGRFDTLVHNSDGTWDLQIQRTRSHLRFSATGDLVAMVDEFGNTQVWTYVNDRLDRITDASGSGRFIQVDWGADGRISDITDPIGRHIHYTYEGGVLTDARNPLEQSTKYEYEPGKYAPRLTEINDHWDRNITTVKYVAADQDRVLSYTEKGETYTYAYGYGGVATTTAKSDSSGNTWVYPFGADGLVAEDIPPGGGPSAKTAYDSNGLVTLYTDAAGVKTHYTHNGRGNLLTKTLDYQGPAAVEWRYVYDPNFPDKTLSVTAYKPGTNEIHPHWQAKKYDFYPPGSIAPGALHHVYEVDNDGMTSRVMQTYTYDSQGRLLTETFADGGVRSLHYDSFGNLERQEGPANNESEIPIRRYTYDSVGRLETATDPLGNTTTSRWDDLNRLVSRTDPRPRRRHH